MAGRAGRVGEGAVRGTLSGFAYGRGSLEKANPNRAVTAISPTAASATAVRGKRPS